MAKKNYRKVAGYMRAVRLMKDKGMTQLEACEVAGISKITFNKYRNELGDEIAPGKIEVLPKEIKNDSTNTSSQPKGLSVTSSDLDKLLAENAALAEQVKLRERLYQLTH